MKLSDTEAAIMEAQFIIKCHQCDLWLIDNPQPPLTPVQRLALIEVINDLASLFGSEDSGIK